MAITPEPGGADSLSAARIRSDLDTVFVGHSLECLAEVDSTNQEARRLAKAGAPDGTLVVADYQTAGRGRLGRQWEAPHGTGLLLSLVWRCGSFLAPSQVQTLTMACGLAVADAIQLVTGLHVGLKWPNDVTVANGKLGGILAEIELNGAEVDYAVVGVGLNVNTRADQFPSALVVPATSLAIELGRPVPRLPLLSAALRAMEARYLALRQGFSPHREWADRLATLNQPVAVSGPGAEFRGIAEGVDRDGALLVRCDDGSLRAVIAADVTLRPDPNPVATAGCHQLPCGSQLGSSTGGGCGKP